MLQPLPAAPSGRSALIATLAALFLLAGCASGPRIVTPEPPPLPDGGGVVPEDNEVVLTNDTQLVADAPWGKIKIEAGPGLRRVYTWRGNRRGVVLEPREQRFAGSMGIHYEGEPPVWEPADGITKVDLEEGQRRFDNVDDALIWMQIRRLRYSYTNDGLVVGWKPKDDTLVVELWQFYIDGKKPTTMPDADDTRLALGPLTPVPQKMKPVRLYADGRREPIPDVLAPAARVVSRDEAKLKAKEASADDTEEKGWFSRTFGGLFGGGSNDQGDSDEAAGETTAQAESALQTPEAADTTGEPAANEAAVASSATANSDSADSTAEEPKDKDENAPRAEIKGNVVNIRSGASTESDVVTQARKGDSVVILKEDRGWRYVKLEDEQKGWVADFLLKH